MALAFVTADQDLLSADNLYSTYTLHQRCCSLFQIHRQSVLKSFHLKEKHSDMGWNL